MSSGFFVKLNTLGSQGFKRAGVESNPVSRPYDFGWRGKVQLPFFTGVDEASWKVVNFEIKDLEPKLVNKLNMLSENDSTKCSNNEAGCLPENGLNPRLKVDVRQLDYLPKEAKFHANDVDAFEYRNNNYVDIDAVSINIYSYTNGLVTTTSGRQDEHVFTNLGSGNSIQEDCGRSEQKYVAAVLKDYIPSSQIKDLACYDQSAICATGVCTNDCVGEYIIGTFELKSRTCQDRNVEACKNTELTTISIPNTKYYTGTNSLDVNYTNLTAKSDEMGERSHTTKLSAHGGHLEFSDDYRYIYGAIGSTNTKIAESLPYTGEMRIKMDTQCNYYYLYGAGRFTYYLTFTAQNLIVHAPYEFLKTSNDFTGVTPLLDTMRRWALFDEVADLTRATGLNKISNKTIVTGAFTSGNASWGKDIGLASFDAELGPGGYVFQFNDNGDKQYRVGTFVNAIAEARVGFKFLGKHYGVTVDSSTSLTAAADNPDKLDSLKTLILNNEFIAEGDMRFNGCVNFEVAHCDGGLKLQPDTRR